MQRFVLAVLALEANRLVTTDRLIDLTWPDGPPATARRIIHTQISRLRATLSGVGADQPLRLRSERAGYLIDGDRHGIDVHRFTALLSRAAEAADDAGRLALLDQALGLWRGPALAGTTDEPTRASLTSHLEEARWTAAEDRLEALLRQGHDEDVIAEASRLAAEHPFRHRFTAQLMLALHHAGRSVDALATYRQAQQHLADEFGLDPPAELQQMELAIIRNEPPDDPTGPPPPDSPTISATPPPPPVPRQLPAPAQTFTGRARELSTLEQAHDASAVVITAIDGMAGIGKTALAVQAAHRIADRYPDGQLFIDLHGYTHGVEPIQPGEALDHLLRALSVPGTQIPTNIDQRAALYRTRLADKRMLIVLDNATTEAQVAPLLPGAPGCLVLITSRRQLAGLDQTHTLSLDTLPTPEAITLFVQTIDERGQPPELLVELVRLCGRLPLALRIAAARLRAHRTWELSYLVERLGDQQHRLGELEAGQRSVTAALDLSYQHLNPDQQRAYRLLGLQPGAEFDAYAAAALLDSTLPHATRLLEQLLEAHLLQEEPIPGRYRFHDLVRAHAARDQTQPARRTALTRLLDYYLHTAALAVDAVYPYEREHRPEVPPAGTPGPDLHDPATALGWLDSELPNLLAAARYTAEHSQSEHVLHLSTILHWHLRSHGRYHDAETLHHQALATARATSNHAGELDARTHLGQIHRLQGRYTQAIDHLEQALRIARVTDHHAGELEALTGLGHIHWRQGRYAQAADHFQEALRIARVTGHRADELEALTGLGRLRWIQGQPTQAADHFGQALHIARATAHHLGELNALTGLGHIHRRQGRYAQAADHFQEALRIAWATGQPVGELSALTGLSQVHRRQSRHKQATHSYQQLLELAHKAGNRNYEFEARQGLGRLSHTTGAPEAAIAHHSQALALADELGQPVDQARAHDGLAHAHHARGQHEQARKHWQHALDILTNIGLDHTDDEETTTAAIRTHLESAGG